MGYRAGLEMLRSAAIQTFRAIPLPVVASQYGVVLTFHATYVSPPPDLIGLDNVRPTTLYEQLSTLKRRFTVVSIDEFCEARSTRGLAAVTFDDGYKSLVTDCWDVLESLDIPVTFFVNSAFFFEKIFFWRDKIRWVINHGLEGEFRGFIEGRLKVGGGDLFAASKDPHVDTRMVDGELDAFFRHKGMPALPNYQFDSTEYLRHSRRVSYGNHSHRHYVLSSLPDADQSQEIIKTHEFLRSQPHIRLSNVFCAPFGDTLYVNQATTEILKELGYKGMVMNRGRLNRTHRFAPNGLRIIERTMVMENPLQTVLQKEYVKSVLFRAPGFCDGVGPRPKDQSGATSGFVPLAY